MEMLDNFDTPIWLYSVRKYEFRPSFNFTYLDFVVPVSYPKIVMSRPPYHLPPFLPLYLSLTFPPTFLPNLLYILLKPPNRQASIVAAPENLCDTTEPQLRQLRGGSRVCSGGGGGNFHQWV